MAEDNLNPWHYDPSVHELRKIIEKQSDLVPLYPVLVSIYNNRISRKALKQTPDRVINYVQVRDFDLAEDQFTPTKHTIKTLPSRATYEMNGEELVLLPNARNSLESKRKVIKVGDKLRGHVLTNRFTPLIPKVNPDFLVMMLNTDFVRDQLIAACRGAGSPDLRENKLSKIMIPVPNKDDLSSIDSFMEGIVDGLAKKNDLEKELLKVSTDIEGAFKKLYKKA
jgi:hypothetical protein